MPANRRYLIASLLFSICIPAYSLSWQGPYIGAYLGAAIGNQELSTNAGTATSTSYFTTATDINSVNNAGSWKKNHTTIIAGLQAGHDWVRDQILYGVAFDFGALPLSSSRTTTNTYPSNASQYSISTSARTNWLLTFRGRAGYTTLLYSQPSLLYFTAGMAITQLKVTNNFSDNSALAGGGNSNTSKNQIGWTAGVGMEVAAPYKNVTIDLEYLYVRVPLVNTTAAVSNTQGGFGIPIQSMTSQVSSSVDFYASLIKVGLNYRFDE